MPWRCASIAQPRQGLYTIPTLMVTDQTSLRRRSTPNSMTVSTSPQLFKGQGLWFRPLKGPHAAWSRTGNQRRACSAGSPSDTPEVIARPRQQADGQVVGSTVVHHLDVDVLPKTPAQPGPSSAPPYASEGHGHATSAAQPTAGDAATREGGGIPEAGGLPPPPPSPVQSGFTDGYDPTVAKGFMPPEGEPMLWWVEKYEGRRKEEAARQQALASGASPAPPTAPQALEPKGDARSPSAQGSTPKGTDSEAAVTSGSKPSLGSRILAAVAAVGQLLQLLVVSAALILWPASRQPGGILVGRIWLLFLAYVIFFAGGTLHRLNQHGPLAPRSQDRQRTSSWASRLSFLAFVSVMPLLHWLPVLRYTGGNISYEWTGYDALGCLCMIVAAGLNWVASRQLGKAYDRLVVPDNLVTGGVYGVIQHPIYTSYMLLFCGFCLVLHSAPSAILMLLVCLLYYRQRCQVEAQVLHEAFGATYQAYQQSTKRFIPFIF